MDKLIEPTAWHPAPTREFRPEYARAVSPLPKGKHFRRRWVEHYRHMRPWDAWDSKRVLIQRVREPRNHSRVYVRSKEAPISPWETPRLVDAIKKLEKATPEEAVAFVGEYGFLGYEGQEVLDGEPLGWMCWQGQRMRYLTRLIRAVRVGAAPTIAGLLRDGVRKQGGVFVPRFFPDALWFCVADVSGPRPPNEKRPKELLWAAKWVLSHEADAVFRRLQLYPFVVSWLPLRVRFRWWGTLLDTVRLGLLLGFFGEGASELPLRICPVCATPYIAGQGKKDCGDPQCGWTRQKRQQRQGINRVTVSAER